MIKSIRTLSFVTVILCGGLWTACGESPTAPPAVDPEAILREEMSRGGLSQSWFRGCIWQEFLSRLPSYQGQTAAFILQDVRSIIEECVEDDGEPDPGSVKVIAATTGEDVDPDGYAVSVDGGGGGALGANDSLTAPDLAPGDHQLELSGVAANCSVDGDNPRTVNVPSGAAATTTFTVTCTALPPTVGTLEVVTDTSGDDADPDGYTVAIGGGTGSAVGSNDTLTTPGLTPGDYQVELSDIAANCSVGGDNPRTVAVTAGTIASTTFTVTCTALPPTMGSLEVVTSTSGDDVDPDGYLVSVGGGAGSAAAVNDTLTTPDLAPGDYEVELSDVAANCSVGGNNPRTVAVSAGAIASTTFTVTCSAVPPPLDGIVFSRAAGGLWIMDSDGSNQTQLTTDGTDQSPDVSADGDKIVFSSLDGGTERDIFTADIDGSNRNQLTDAATAGGESHDPEWSPDGSKIVFYSDRNGGFEVWVMDADGSNPVALTSTGTNALPSWSPDGSQIVFVSDRDGNFEVYVMDADGSNQTRLTSTTASEFNPAFSPDGTRIAFDANRDAVTFDVYVIDADGSDPVRLTTDPDDDTFPQWSPDGQLLAFSSEQDGTATIWSMGTDGSNQTNLSQTGPDFLPTWVP